MTQENQETTDQRRDSSVESIDLFCSICSWSTPPRPTPEVADMRITIHMNGHTDDELRAHYKKVNEDYFKQNGERR